MQYDEARPTMIDDSGRLLDILFDRMPMGIAVIDREYRIRRVNPTWATFIEQYAGTDSGQVVPGAFLFDLEPGTEDVIKPLFERVFAGETVRQQGVRLDVEGRASFWDIVLTPLDVDGEVTALLDVSLDATQRQQILDNLQESETKFRLLFEKSADGMLLLDGDTILDANEAAVRMMGYPDKATLQGLAPYDFSPEFQPDGQTSIAKYQKVIAAALEKGSQRFEWIHRRADGRNVPVEVLLVVVPVGGQGILHVTWRDVTERVLVREQLEAGIAARTHELERRQAVAASLADILKVINSTRPQAEMLDYIVQQACRLVDASVCVLHHIDYQSQFVSIEASCGLPAELLDVSGFPLGSARADDVILAAQPVAIGDLPQPKSATHQDSTVYRWQQTMGRAYRAFLAVPLVMQDRVYGSLAFYFKSARVFDQQEIDLAMSLGDQAALAIENARLRHEAQNTAVAAERTRLARELHDAVTQTLFSASLIAEVLPMLWEKDAEAGRERLAELRELTRGALAEMRTLLLELRPSTLSESRLDDLLRQLAEGVVGRSRLPVQVRVCGERTLPVEVKVALYRIAQESLANVVRHAAATCVEITLDLAPESVRLSIEDDGSGFDASDVTPTSLGLGIMRERADSIGASLEIVSELGHGTRVDVCWPADEETP